MRSTTAADAQAICSIHRYFALQSIFTFEEAAIVFDRAMHAVHAVLAGLLPAPQP